MDEHNFDSVTQDVVAVRGTPRALSRGTSVGRYLVLDPIGEGGMGVVYKAYDPELSRSVALKLLHPAVGAEQIVRDRLLREAKALARLSHPSVVTIHDVGTFGDDVFIATEFVAGATLRAWRRARQRSRAETLSVFRAAGEGLAAAHRAGLVHRDFKPDNVIVGDDGRVRVIDFGLARDATSGRDDAAALSAPDRDAVTPETIDERAASSRGEAPPPDLLRSPLTVAGAILGTPMYMPPSSSTEAPSTRAAINSAIAWRSTRRSTGDDPSSLPSRGREARGRPRSGWPKPAPTTKTRFVWTTRRRGRACRDGCGRCSCAGSRVHRRSASLRWMRCSRRSLTIPP